ncbi:hypothetical protein O181_094100 [Austropuccinia psidii MF-1]|uniref:Uncharacterized protein n=1 Tax=Austropuccinia psidii MF-1 TaxID=1389203 RepID=A0A9Q3J1G0_9BASI|nr:hypothetical protein [Austropuccinia psidii MF-1]
MPSTRSGASYNPSSSSQKDHKCDYDRSQSVTEEQGSADDLQINKLCHSEADNTILPSNRSDTATRSQHKEYQILADIWKNFMNSYPTVRKFLGHPNTSKLLNGWHPLIAKKNMMILKAEWRKNNPPPPKKVPKTAPVASSSNSSVKGKPQAQNKGKGKAPATKTYSQGYRIPKAQQEAMKNVFQMSRTMMQLQKKEEARLKYQK